MAKTPTITIPRIVAALKEAGFATKKDIQDALVNERKHTKKLIQDELAIFYTEHLEPTLATKDELQDLRKEMKSGFNKLEVGHKDLQRQINDLKVDTPTQKEFDELKTRIARYHPIN